MSIHILDTDTLSHYQAGHPEVCKLVQAAAAELLGIAVITVEEQLSGWYRLIRQAKKPEDVAAAYDRLAKTVTLLAGLRVYSYSVKAITRYKELQALKLMVKKNDLRIAAIVLENDATLVTRNLRDFQRVPGLKIVNWAG